LTLALAAKATMAQAVTLANLAAGVVVEKLGTATASPKEILAFAEHRGVQQPRRSKTAPKKTTRKKPSRARH